MDINTHESIFTELSALNMTGGKVLLHLIKQIHRSINEISGDGAYDTVRIERADPFIPQSKGTSFWVEV
ncbi:Mobile element protein [Candidatus Enterovibrio altilux]|uniref:Mobile element protein n=1 Tax=Candidatus Enterovibrio altilux TaxID=1927128 RepID=A0A291BBZ6_9GAMM|nr:Mobile element protein [Candidatus Enterovibrio luxaltus]